MRRQRLTTCSDALCTLHGALCTAPLLTALCEPPLQGRVHPPRALKAESQRRRSAAAPTGPSAARGGGRVARRRRPSRGAGSYGACHRIATGGCRCTARRGMTVFELRRSASPRGSVEQRRGEVFLGREAGADDWACGTPRTGTPQRSVASGLALDASSAPTRAWARAYQAGGLSAGSTRWLTCPCEHAHEGESEEEGVAMARLRRGGEAEARGARPEARGARGRGGARLTPRT